MIKSWAVLAWWCYWNASIERNNRDLFQYNVASTCVNAAGGGGEYEVQEGFGWTNGVILDLLLTYGPDLSFSVEDSVDSAYESETESESERTSTPTPEAEACRMWTTTNCSVRVVHSLYLSTIACIVQNDGVSSFSIPNQYLQIWERH